jgi:hypothetical protein
VPPIRVTRVHEFALTDWLSLSFQRYPYPPAGSFGALPPSCGALPIVVRPVGELTVPCPAGEAFWIGLVHSQVERQACTVSVVTVVGATDPIAVPPHYAFGGTPRADGTTWALAREAAAEGATPCDSLVVEVASAAGERASARVALVDVEEFEALSGYRLPPLEEDAAYGGWRLP